jgi:hypothetical protein
MMLGVRSVCVSLATNGGFHCFWVGRSLLNHKSFGILGARAPSSPVSLAAILIDLLAFGRFIFIA